MHGFYTSDKYLKNEYQIDENLLFVDWAPKLGHMQYYFDYKKLVEKPKENNKNNFLTK